MKLSLKAAWSSLGRNLGPTSPRLINFYSGGPTASGETVNIDTAMRLETVWACVRLIASTIATLPLQLYKRNPTGLGSVEYSHSLYPILHDQPNADMTAVVFWEALVACFLLWGNAYAKITRLNNRVIALTPIKPDRVTPMRRPLEGSFYYIVHTPTGDEIVDESEMMHFKGFSLDGILGVSIIAQARESLGLALAAEKTSGSLFRNGMRSLFAITMPSTLDPVQRRRYEEEFLPKFSGALNAGRTPLLEAGWDIKSLAMNPADAQLLATREFSIEQLCRWFQVQPVMIGHMSKSTAWGSGLEQMNLWFLTYTLRPVLRAFEQEIRRSLLTPLEKTQYYAEFNVEGLLRADSTARAALMKVMVENGLRTRNEQRAVDNYPPLPGGDELTVMSNTLPCTLLGIVARMSLDKPIDPPSASNQNDPVPVTDKNPP